MADRLFRCPFCASEMRESPLTAIVTVVRDGRKYDGSVPLDLLGDTALNPATARQCPTCHFVAMFPKGKPAAK